MMKATKGGRERGRDKDRDGDSKPTTQKTIQIKQTNKIKEIMSTFSASKPTNVDAQRVICVLDTLIQKIQILQFIDSDLANSLSDKSRGPDKEELLAQLSENTSLLLTRELEYEAKLKPLLSGQDSVDKTVEEGSQTPDLGTIISATAKNLRNLIRELQTNPDDLEIIKRLRKNPQLDDYEDFIVYLRGLRVLMLKRLSTSVEEQAAIDRQKQELERKIQIWERNKNNKELELRNLKKEKEKYVAEKDEELTKLKILYEEVEMNKAKKKADLQEERERDKQIMKKNFLEKEDVLNKQLATLENELRDLRANNKKEELDLGEKVRRAEINLRDIMEQYDAMMDTTDQEVQDIELELQRVEKEMKDYRESIAILKKEEEKDKEIEKKVAVKKEIHETEEERISKIVQAIQDAWKIYKVKAKVGKKKKGGKGKDAKGKDGKGGKDAKGAKSGKTTKR